MAVINELVTVFSFKGTTKPLIDFNSSLGKSIKLLSIGTSIIYSANAAIGAFIHTTLQGLDPLIDLSKRTGVSIGAIQELGYAASVSGSSMEAVEQSISGLSRRIGEAARTGSDEFKALGINVRDSFGNVKTADVILGELQNRFKQLGLSLQEQQSFAKALGIDSSLLELLNQSSDQVNQLRAQAKALGTITEEQAAAAAKYNDSITILKFGLSGIQNQIAVGVAPEFTRLTEGFTKILAENKDWIINGVEKTITVLGSFLSALNRLLPVFALVAGAFAIAQLATLGLSGALGVLFSPVVLITAAIVGIFLAIDDLIVAFRGGKSVIADFFDSFFGAGATQKFLQEFVQGFVDSVNQIKAIFAGLFDYILAFFTGDFVKASSIVVSGLSKVGEFFGFNGQENVQKNPVNNNQQTSNQITQTNDIKVYSSDPVQAGNQVNDKLQKQLLDTKTKFNTGGR